MIGSIAVFVFFFVYEWVFHELIMNSWYQEALHLFRPAGQMAAFMPWMVAGFLVMAFGFCLVFLKGYEGKGIGEGVRYGIYVAVAFGVSVYMINYAVFPHPPQWVLAWILGFIIMLMAGGGLFAAIYKK